MHISLACRGRDGGSKPSRHGGAAFTLVELLVSMTVLTVLLLLVTSVVGSVQGAWHQAHSKVSEFREARRAFDRMVNAISQASLNNYLVYRYPNNDDPLTPPSKTQTAQPSGYARYSELQFICGRSSSATDPPMTGLPPDISPGHAIFFQAPMGTTSEYRLPTSLNGCGFFVQFGSDRDYRPDFLNNIGQAEVYRYRLYEYRAPTENNRAYDPDSNASGRRWYEDFAQWSKPIANNVVLLVLSPRRSQADKDGLSPVTDIAPFYTYNTRPKDPMSTTVQDPSEYQLPPMVAVTFVVVDEASATNMSIDNGTSPPLRDVLNTGLFQRAETYHTDLDLVVKGLVDKKINFRVFTATVPIRASKWGQGT
ncbi:uncharacterized protein (TIGR02599 family) [Roseimicrobium gellanilyticum]|uniref:Uncharacterized protein (TIGR02599 family) n=1 Tax=Roseimicrobium gellanilyticum TaxID=748857 RepID=A0A366HWL3_9BACT|nr:Verru_Chthon cassette protein C [Roseimicrobium gellanilyticum]RBP47688.1 uncharacterized protein (TIGR02599 family) [Roseimicrobium gellanilyticum]